MVRFVGCWLLIVGLVTIPWLNGCKPEMQSGSGVGAMPPKALPVAQVAGEPAAAAASATAVPGAPRVIVVGAGISGLTTALELGRGGADVTVVDMSSVYGGHAVMSQGSLCLIGSPVQKAAGIEDRPDLAYEDFIRWGEDVDREWVRYYCDHSIDEIYDWVTELGVRFEGVGLAPGNSVPRETQPAGRGIGLVTPIYRACLDLPNVKFLWNTKAEQLVSENARVAGVVVRNLRTDEEQTLRAGAVVLATGGFQSNLDMVREFWPAEFRFPERIFVGSGRNSVGFGHELAKSAGGALTHMDHQWNYFTGIPDPRFPGTNRGLSAANMSGIIVNAEGKQFANLHGWAKEVMPPFLRQKPATLWFVFDEATKPAFVVSGTDWADFKKVEREILQNPKFVQIADTWEELAKKAGLPPENLRATVERYNEAVEKGVDEEFHRFGPGYSRYPADMSPKLATPPFYAMQAWPLTRKSLGGVAIDRQCRVIDKDKRAIPGLFAVGELAGLAGINGKAALEGTFLGPCILTGRVAARSILAGVDRSTEGTAGETTAAGSKSVKTRSCRDCHEIEADIADPRPGYWHFESVHKVALERHNDCRHCHADLVPYRAATHRIHPPSLAATCVQCHIARE